MLLGFWMLVVSGVLRPFREDLVETTLQQTQTLDHLLMNVIRSAVTGARYPTQDDLSLLRYAGSSIRPKE